ncbi:MAG: bifunctional DNA primase/polymerase [Candidatus Paceibacterota bacterium]
MANNLNTKIEWALYYQDIGWSIIPVGVDKRPLIKWEIYQTRCSSIEDIKKWWELWPNANPAVVTGKISGIVVLDIDKKHNRSSKEFHLPPTVYAKSGSGGEHFFFRHPGGYIKSVNAFLNEGVDIKADGGYVVVHPSINEIGQYDWIIPPENGLSEIPEWLMEALQNNKKGRGVNKLWQKDPAEVLEGNRNETATSVAGKIRNSLPPELLEIVGWSGLNAWNQTIPKPISESELSKVWESIKKYPGVNSPKDNSLLNEICSREDVTLFHDEQNNAYIALDINGHQEIWPCKGKYIKKLLASKSWEKNKKPLGSESIKSIVAVLEGKACFGGSEIELQNRIAWRDEELWYDLTNKKWQAIKINKNGWEIVSKPPIIFKRYPHHKAQVIPIRDGDVKLFLNYVNVVNAEHRLLLLVFLVSCLIPDFPHVMLVVFGAQGSSKSTLSKLTRLIIDPSLIDVASFPNSQKELIQTLAHHHFLFFDNVSYISEEHSDTLCKAITGGGHVKRELYENDEDIIYNFKRCIGINGINLVTTRPDLLERSLLLELERIESSERKTEKELYENFEKDLPSILGGIFEVLVKAIQIKPTINLDSHPRMADWALWGCAIAEALGYERKDFLSAYANNMNRQTEMLLNENIVATTLFIFMEDKENWEGTPTKLLQELYAKTPIDYFDKQEKYWPKSAASLSRKLNELSTYLKQMGISVTMTTLGYERKIHIRKKIEVAQKPKQQSINDSIYDTDDIIPKDKDGIDDIPMRSLPPTNNENTPF